MGTRVETVRGLLYRRTASTDQSRMTYRCALLGHDYGDTEIEHEEEQRDDVLITTVREVEQCRRCDDHNVVTEYPITTPLNHSKEAEEEPAEKGAGNPEASVADQEVATDVQVRETETSPRFACPGCGFITKPDTSPLQAGDLCPDCHQNYLTDDPVPEQP